MSDLKAKTSRDYLRPLQEREMRIRLERAVKVIILDAAGAPRCGALAETIAPGGVSLTGSTAAVVAAVGALALGKKIVLRFASAAHGMIEARGTLVWMQEDGHSVRIGLAITSPVMLEICRLYLPRTESKGAPALVA